MVSLIHFPPESDVQSFYIHSGTSSKSNSSDQPRFLYLYWFTRVWNRRYCLCVNFVILKKCRDTRPQHKIIKLRRRALTLEFLLMKDMSLLVSHSISIYYMWLMFSGSVFDKIGMSGFVRQAFLKESTLKGYK